jgi:hypothetical protein
MMCALRFARRGSTAALTLKLLVIFLMSIAASQAQAESASPWELSAGVSLGYVDTTVHAKDGTRQATLDVDSLLSPFVRLGYGLTPSLRLEVMATLDVYSGTLTEQTGNGSSSLRGFGLSAGPTWVGTQRSSNLAGLWRPLLHAGIRYEMLRGDLDYPVEKFDNAWGLDVGCGLLLKNWEFRLTGTWVTHDNGKQTPGFNPAESSDDLNLSRIALECAWHFSPLR